VGSRGGTGQAEWRRASPLRRLDVRGRSGGVGAEAVADVGEERAPVSDRAVLQLEVEAREVAAARRRTREGKSRRGGERARSAVMGSGFKRGGGGVAAEGGSGEHGQRVEEAGKSKGGQAQRGAAWRQRSGHGTTVEGGGVGATWDDMADRWAGTRWGPGHQQLDAGRGSVASGSAWC
jgi:hypothetical protein